MTADKTTAPEPLDQLRPIRDRLGKHGDLYMRLNGFYRVGPDGPGEPEFGYNDFRQNGFHPPIQLEAADALADLCASGQQVRALEVDDLAQIIRVVDGNNTLGAGALAEAILEAMPVPRIVGTPAPTPATPTAQEAVPVRSWEGRPFNDAWISEITLDALGQWPSFEAQSWACKVVHALYANHPPQPSEEVAEALRLIGEARLWLDTGFDLAGETLEYSPESISQILDRLDAALRALKGGFENE